MRLSQACDLSLDGCLKKIANEATLQDKTNVIHWLQVAKKQNKGWYLCLNGLKFKAYKWAIYFTYPISIDGLKFRPNQTYRINRCANC